MEDVIEECASSSPPVLQVLHQLEGCQQVTGPIEEGSVSHVSGQVTLRPGTPKDAAKSPRVDGRGAEGTVAAFPHSLLHFSLDVQLQVKSRLRLLCTKMNLQ